ncbi:MAG TPA: aldehyde ferredoxin oxidoreductase family protein [Thermoplasmata archaeon]|nr:aldehyde ferredoxin oxidoreductase family protein [Thermoplasmata archaeon]
MSGGYQGKLAFIDLSRDKCRIENLNERDAKRFIGGKGLGLKILWDQTPAHLDPFDPTNPLIFVTGPLTGTLCPTSGRFAVCTKSPQTGIGLDSQVGGYFGPEIKKAGFDVIIIQGKSENPVYLFIDEGQTEIKDGMWLWGKSTSKTVKALREKHSDQKLRVASIGIAGENLVKYACINVDSHEQKQRGGQAGRGGAGAVMGSKNLKAVAVRGSKRVTYADERRFKDAVKVANKKISTDSFIPKRRNIGTPIWINPMSELGILPTKNFQHATFPLAEQISGERMKETIVRSNKSCFNCPIQCGKQSEVNYKGERIELEGPEYELLALMGSNCGIGSLAAVSKGALMADELGLDGISSGNVIGFAMEAAEKGLISKAESKDLRFGNEDAFLKMIEKIAKREGIGDLLAEGVKKAAKTLGGGSERFAMEVKGMEMPGYEPRGSWGMALAYATSDRGACHQRVWTVRAETEGKLGERFSTLGRARFVKEGQDERSAAYSLVVCDFAPLGVNDFVGMLNSATGFDLEEGEYLLAGERIWNLARMYAVREGISRKDDYMPKRLEEPLPDGPTKGKRISKVAFDSMLDEYYKLRGWSREGIPTSSKLRELDLGGCYRS